MVAYAFVRVLPQTATVFVGGALAIVLVDKAPQAAWAPIAAIALPAAVSALGNSRPSEPIDFSKFTGGGASLLFLLLRAKLGLVALALGLSACVSGSPAPTPQVGACAAAYQACVASSATMADYVACRARVDESCLPASADGGAT
jgi:hypothetical protein